MKLEYNGFLNKLVADWIHSAAQEYNYVLELSSLPKNWTKWSEENLIDFEIGATGCQGEHYTRKTKMYSIVHRGNDGDDKSLFLFLKSIKDYKKIILNQSSYIINESPFKTIMD